MTAAILERHGLRTGAYLSPHLVSYCERVLVGEQEMDPDGFADAVSRAAWAAERVNRTLAGDDHVTQFELLTAAAFWHMARPGSRSRSSRPGSGGATTPPAWWTRRSRCSPTSASSTPAGWARRWGTSPRRSSPPCRGRGAGARRGPRRGGARGRQPGGPRAGRRDRARPPPAAGLALRAQGAFQERNFALARAAAGAYLEHAGVPVSEQAVAEAAAATEVPGRLQVIDRDPLTILDGAHNPHAVASLLRALPELVGERPLALVLGVLDDKDAAGDARGPAGAGAAGVVRGAAGTAGAAAGDAPLAGPSARLRGRRIGSGRGEALSGRGGGPASGGRGARDRLGVPRRRGARRRAARRGPGRAGRRGAGG